MSNVQGVLSVEVDHLGFWCPGCDHAHYVSDAWAFNNDYDKPTFSPSVLVYAVQHFIDPTLEGDALHAPENIGTTPRCHSFVNCGRIQFLDDSTHPLAGQTVDIPAWPYKENQ